MEMYCSTCERTFDAIVGVDCPRDGTRLIRLVSQQDPFAGRDLDGRYVVKEKLGQGGMGAVYRAVQRSVDREVAIKVVNPSMMADPAIIKRFLREARLASRLNHPNAVAVLDFGQTADGVFYLVMELVKGKTLEAILDAEGTLSPARLIPIASQICLALEGAHAVPMVHRDLKPANVILDHAGFVKVLDFGIAKSLSPDTISGTMTGSGAVVGSPGFMPPEIAQGRPCDERADQYSLGCILYLAVTGKLPFDAETLPAIMRMHAVEPVPPLPATVPRALEAIILRLLAKDPDARFATAADVRAALETALANPASSTPWTAAAKRRIDQATTIPKARPYRRARWPWLLGSIVAIGAGVTAAIALREPEKMGSEPISPAATKQAPGPVSQPIVTPLQEKGSDPFLPAAPEPIPEPPQKIGSEHDAQPAKPKPGKKAMIAKPPPIKQPPPIKPPSRPVTPPPPRGDTDPPPF
jgi:serine/threonine-protein kinase